MGWGGGWRPALVLLLGSACSSTPGPSGAPPSPSSTTTVTTAAGAPVRIALRVERRVHDRATENFAAVVHETLEDRRGWAAAGFDFAFSDDAPFTVVLAEGPEVDRLCRPYDVYGKYSCQNGPVVALNADRWRTATPKWTGDLATYRRMLVNHEVGHLLGLDHPATHCPQPGTPAPVMTQQSTELDGCLPNPWPLRWELDCAARHHDPLAPGYEDHPRSACGPE